MLENIKPYNELIILLNPKQSKQMLNLSTRQQRRFGAQQIFTQSMAEMSLRKNRMLASTGFSNANKSMYTTKLPQLSRSFSSSKSTKLKLTTIEATLSSIQQHLQQLRLQTRESRRYCNFLKDDLGENLLGSLKLDLSTTINKFDKMFKLSRNNDQERSKALNMDCQKLRESSASLKSQVQLIRQKIDNCQSVMGLYSGKEKHKV